MKDIMILGLIQLLIGLIIFAFTMPKSYNYRFPENSVISSWGKSLKLLLGCFVLLMLILNFFYRHWIPTYISQNWWKLISENSLLFFYGPILEWFAVSLAFQYHNRNETREMLIKKQALGIGELWLKKQKDIIQRTWVFFGVFAIIAFFLGKVTI